MLQKKCKKLVSLILTAMLLLSTVSGALSLNTSAAATAFDLQAIVDAAKLEVTNDTTQADYETALKALTLPSGYSVVSVDDYYVVDAIEGAYEDGTGAGAYEGAPEYEELVPGEDGSIGALVTVSTPEGNKKLLISTIIEAPMKAFTFGSVSNSIDDWTGDNTSGYKWNGEWIDKIIIPDEITKLANDWHSWQGQKCIVYGKGLDYIGRAAWLSNVQVVSFKGNPTTIGNLAFHQATSLTHIRIPDSVKEIGSEAFYNCKSLKHLRLPEGLKLIKENVFCKADDMDSGFYLEELVIPAGLDNLYEPTFAGARVPCEITMLSKTDKPGWNVFYNNNEDQIANFENLTIRAYSDSAAYRDFNSVNEKIDINTSVTLAEGIARAALGLDFTDGFYSTAAAAKEAEAAVIDAYAKGFLYATSISSAFANEEWVFEDGTWNNTLNITKGDTTAEVPVHLPGTIDIGATLEKVAFTNDTTAESLLAELNTLLPSDVTATVTEFYKLRATDGVVEVGSTYEGAVDGEILVPGGKGYVSAVVTATTPGGTFTTRVNRVIEPTMHEYAFASVSNDMAYWAGDNTSGYKYTGGAVDKLVIPDEITNLIGGWWPNWHNGQKFKCVVFGEGITAIPQQTGLSAEVVSFKGAVTQLNTGAFHNAANLKYMRLPDTVKTISAQSFRNCANLTSLYLPYGLETLNSYMFIVPAEDKDENGVLKGGYNVPEITIPATVTKLPGDTLSGAASDVDITVLTHSSDWSWSVFYSSSYDKSFGEHIYVRGFSDDATVRWNTLVNPATVIDDMTLAEAATRVWQLADIKGANNTYTDVDALNADVQKLLTAFKGAYGNAANITVAFKDAFTETNGFVYNNTIVVTKGEESVELPFSVSKDVTIDLQAMLDEAGVVVNNYTTKDSLMADIKALGFDGYDIRFIDYYLLQAFNGAIERGSTYEGAPTEDLVLVEGTDGYAAAIVSIKASNGAEVVTTLKYHIPATYAIYSFDSVTDDEYDWEVDENGALVSYYGSAEKVVVPDYVTSLPTDWLAWDSTTKCMVFGTGLKSIPRCLGVSGCEVVSFKGENLTEIGGLAFYQWSKLKYIKMPDSVTSVGAEIFRFNSVMEQLYLSKNLDRINNGPMFFKPDDTGSHNITQFTIPASVTYIVADAFAGAGKPCDVTILSKSNNLWNSNVFYSADYPERGQNYTLHLWQSSASGTADKQYATANPKYYLDNMGVCEAWTRTMLAASEMANDSFSDGDSVAAELAAATFGVTSFTAAWANDDWTEADTNMTNELILTKSGYSLEVPVSLVAKAGFYTVGANILKAADFEANGSKQKLTFSYSFDSDAEGKYEGYTITDFGVVAQHVNAAIADESFVIGAEGASVYAATAASAYDAAKGKTTYTAAIKNIPQGGREYSFQLRGYVKYTDANGAEQIAYSDSLVTSAKQIFDTFASTADYAGMETWFTSALN